MRTLTKRGRSREIAWEAAGLRWLSDAGAVRIAAVVGHTAGCLELEHVAVADASPAAAEALGRGLAAMHAAGAPAFGAPPEGWEGDGFLGPGADLLPLPLVQGTWGVAYAAQLRAVGAVAHERGRFAPQDVAALERLCATLESGALDDGVPPARVHGDLWAGNVLWDAQGAVLIDPAAHGAHPQLDLALLELFGVPHLDRIVQSYCEVATLPAGWRERTSLHQALHLVLHAACFGGGYVAQARRVIDRWA